jgi:hypothetical protein
MSSDIELNIQNMDMIISGRRAEFLLPVTIRATGPTMPRRIAPYSINASEFPKLDVKKPVDHAWCA